MRGIIGAIGLLPLAVSMKTGAAFGRLLQMFAGKLNRVARRNLNAALPELNDAEKSEIVRECFAGMGRQLGFISHFQRFEQKDFDNLIDVAGREHLDAARQSGRGTLFFTGHLGGWEVLILGLSALNYPINVLVRRMDNPKLDEFVQNLRTRFNGKTIDKTASARTMMRVLQQQGILGITADLNSQEREGVFVDFFGIAASTSAGLARLALKNDAVVLPIFVVWQPEKRKYLLHIDAPVKYDKTGDSALDTLNLTQKVTNVIEDFVRAFPAQWMWIHKRWNTRPPNEPKFY